VRRSEGTHLTHEFPDVYHSSLFGGVQLCLLDTKVRCGRVGKFEGEELPVHRPLDYESYGAPLPRAGVCLRAGDYGWRARRLSLRFLRRQSPSPVASVVEAGRLENPALALKRTEAALAQHAEYPDGGVQTARRLPDGPPNFRHRRNFRLPRAECIGKNAYCSLSLRSGVTGENNLCSAGCCAPRAGRSFRAFPRTLELDLPGAGPPRHCGA
jgi:hypothetical protein